jgi:hypothetical protein
MYLQKKMFDAAISYCKNNWQRDVVRIAQAEDRFNAREYEQAAVFYAMTSKSFEEITLKFIHLDQRDALKTFSFFHFPLFCSYFKEEISFFLCCLQYFEMNFWL